MAEYRALRACVLRLWREEDPNGFAKGADDISRFTEAVDQALGQTIRIFEQPEAQYRDRFLAILGHDLRNPLNSILLSATSLAQARELSEKQLAIVERITSSSRRLNFMVNDLLDFARGRLGSPMPISAVPTNLGALVPEVVDEVQSANPNVVIAIEMNGDLNGDWDTERLKQLLSNLLTNAVQHGSGKNVGVRLESDENIVSLEVHNEGAPIPEELLATMFDPLVHGQNPDQNRTGLGLGLFIVSEIASAHHGTIEVTSTQDAGTTFSVRLPRHSQLKAGRQIHPRSNILVVGRQSVASCDP